MRVPLGLVRFGGRPGCELDYVVLIWTVGGHTYGVGFHNVRGIRATLALDIALARSIKLVRG
jgi:hypothetical protein